MKGIDLYHAATILVMYPITVMNINIHQTKQNMEPDYFFSSILSLYIVWIGERWLHCDTGLLPPLPLVVIALVPFEMLQ